MDLDLDHTKSFSEVIKLHFRKRLGQHIGYMLLCCHILEIHCSSLHHIPDIVELDLDVLRLVMKHGIFRQLHATLVVAEDTSHIQLKIKQVRQYISYPHFLTTIRERGNILYLSCTQFHAWLLPVEPEDHDRSQTKGET